MPELERFGAAPIASGWTLTGGAAARPRNQSSDSGCEATPVKRASAQNPHAPYATNSRSFNCFTLFVSSGSFRLKSRRCQANLVMAFADKPKNDLPKRPCNNSGWRADRARLTRSRKKNCAAQQAKNIENGIKKTGNRAPQLSSWRSYPARGYARPISVRTSMSAFRPKPKLAMSVMRRPPPIAPRRPRPWPKNRSRRARARDRGPLWPSSENRAPPWRRTAPARRGRRRGL